MDRQSRNQSGELSRAVRRDNILHYIMAFVGGYMGAYSIFGWDGLFAQAQTANMIQMVDNLTTGNCRELALRLTAVCIFCIAVLLSTVLQKKTRADLRKTSILFNMAVVMVECWMPSDTDRFLALYPVFFAMTFQWCIFSKTGGYGSSTIFSTNNLRQCISAYGEYYMERGKENLKKARFFRNTIGAYHAGVFICLLVFHFLEKMEILLCLVPLAVAWLVETRSNHF